MTPPTPDQLNALPKTALRAFAARCARRVVPLYRVFVRRAPEHLVAIERAVDLAERRASLGQTDQSYDKYDLQALAHTLAAIREAALNTEADANDAPLGDPFGDEACAYVTVALAAEAAFAVAFADEIYADGQRFDPGTFVAGTLGRISMARGALREKIAREFSRDFENISRIAGSRQTAAQTCGYGPDIFGPMWPDGRPAGWPGDYVAAFKPRARLMLLLGDQLIREAGIAVFELVKNAYDADATACNVILHNIDQGAHVAEITVTDDGCGMDEQTLLRVWLEPGTDHRAKQRDQQLRTPRFGRQVLGEKGVGRFAVHKLGQVVTVVTRAEGKPELFLTIDWAAFADADYLGDVPIQFSARAPQIFTEDRTGTYIHVKNLHEAPWTRGRVRSLHRAIASIRSPFGGPDTFEPELKLEGRHALDWLYGLLRVEDVIEEAPFKLSGSIEGSTLRYDYTFRPGARLDRVEPRTCHNEMIIVAEDDDGNSHRVAVDPATVGTVRIDLYIFDRTPQILKLTASDPKGLKDFLNFNGGVRVYRNGIRVYDFGEPGNDWLELGGRRVNVPSQRISNNQILGTIQIPSVSQTGTGLIEKTNREGFVENDAYRAFHSAMLFAITQAEQERNIDKKRIRMAYAKGREKELVISDLAELRSELKARNLESQLGEIVDRVESQYREVTERLLVSAGAGLNLAIVLHEVEKNIYDLKEGLERGEDRAHLLERAKRLSDMVDGLTWLTKRSGLSDIALKDLIGHAITNWRFRYSHHRITVTNGIAQGDPEFQVRGYRRLLLTTVMNLVDNSIHWLDTKAENRRIYIGTTRNLDGKPALIVADNGPGFLDDPEVLTEPFFTRRPEGMGLGLYIADQIMKQHEGKLVFPMPEDLELDPAFDGAVVAMQFSSTL
jgi:signal transduction histidine kinase